ncbi:HalOD1 output domain-containing protein [Natronorubrum aibiense]|uniref:Halobacterial output domain-containing protein n=1 Tax=Natronorubrum aibiense TaxID=348826 RepID=A0A5P9P9I4_9EURY|nr:HalOD1 output domain-containing protein [Natronorubrum aibiense]QFU84657.1 hypothetical protein GCU68_19195 [Natronorubrum aibiense]
MTHDQPVSLKVVQSVAERDGVPVEELEPPLHNAIDTDALDSLFRATTPEKIPSMVEFSYNGYTIRIDKNGAVTVIDQLSNTVPETEVV